MSDRQNNMGLRDASASKNGDTKTEKGPHGDLGPQMGIHVGAVHLVSKELNKISVKSTCSVWRRDHVGVKN